MKRTLIASILGIAASVVSSYGNGFIWFNTYVVNNYHGAPVTYYPGSSPVSGLWNVQMAYYVGTGITDPSSSNSLLSNWNLDGAVVNTTFFDKGYVAVSPSYSIPAYPSTGGVPVELEMLVFNGVSYAGSTIRAHSAAFTLPSIAVGVELPTTMNGLVGFSLIPEPSTFALAGLGAAGWLSFRRRNGAR